MSGPDRIDGCPTAQQFEGEAGRERVAGADLVDDVVHALAGNRDQLPATHELRALGPDAHHRIACAERANRGNVSAGVSPPNPSSCLDRTHEGAEYGR